MAASGSRTSARSRSATDPSATSVITVATNGTQAYATLDSLHDTAIQAVNQSTNNFDTVTHNHVLCGPAAQPFGGAQKPTFRALVEADLPSYLVESTLEQTFYTQTIVDSLLAAKAPLSTGAAPLPAIGASPRRGP